MAGSLLEKEQLITIRSTTESLWPTYSVRRGEVSRVGVAGGDEGVEGVRGGVERLTVAVEDDVVVTVVFVVLVLLVLVLLLLLMLLVLELSGLSAVRTQLTPGRCPPVVQNWSVRWSHARPTAQNCFSRDFGKLFHLCEKLMWDPGTRLSGPSEVR